MVPPLQILVIDDQEVDRYLVRRTVKKWDPEAIVFDFGDANEALQLLSDPARVAAMEIDVNLPLVVLLDVKMPRMTGFELLERIYERLGPEATKSLMVVMMFTSSDNRHDRERAAEFPVVCDYFVKPLCIEHLDRIAGIHGRVEREHCA